MVLKAQRSLSQVKDKRLYWLKEQYLKLFFENEECSGPKPAEAIKVTTGYSQIFLSWPLGAERQTCHVTLIVPHVMN